MRGAMGGDTGHVDRSDRAVSHVSTPRPAPAGRDLASFSELGETDRAEDHSDTSEGGNDA
jgi:hypothetical protein